MEFLILEEVGYVYKFNTWLGIINGRVGQGFNKCGTLFYNMVMN